MSAASRSDILVPTAVDAASASGLRVPSVFGIMLIIGALKASLKVVGFERTWRWLQQSTTGVAEVEIDRSTVMAVERAVAMAAALYPGRAFCLERSLALYHYLRRHGVPARYQMGVQRYPFGAHAWVEFRGEVINDVPEHVKRYRSIDGIGL